MTSTDLHALGESYRAAREGAERARVALHAGIKAAAAAGMSESEMARVTGVQRETVRKALGK